MNDVFRIDSHKLLFHPMRVSKWFESFGEWEKEKEIYPIYVEVSPYGACNHRCTFCGVDYMGYKNIKIDLEIYKKTIQEMGTLGVKSVMFAGEGEPLLHRDLDLMIEATNNAGVDVGITTNFVPLKKEKLERILKNTTWIKASINAGNAESYAKIHRTKEDDFYKALDNLKEALKAREQTKSNCTIGVQMLLLPQNYKSTIEFALTLKEVGVDYLVVKPYSQHLFSKTREYEGLDYKEYLFLEKSLKDITSDKFSIIFRADTMRKLDGNRDSYKKCYSTPYFWGYISANGDVYGCSCYLSDERFSYGNINKSSFKEIWQSQKRRENIAFIQNELDIKKCRVNCRMDSINRYLWELKHPNSHVNFI
ncbi:MULTISPECIES: radical SAM protein [Helicobacter]|uniref:Radical SAM protein n=1 Tax=Helicobacter ibis TaxID=2962633 RepID=A0ABT4VEK6_9HELI|nr:MULTISPECIES: radical SAM protein [Helicobacter]MDA3967414.1 radical SAM protein [Helicobacter sp. WB40]MDA3969142.1 radical SAM protein [Helicobacter ibis]